MNNFEKVIIEGGNSFNSFFGDIDKLNYSQDFSLIIQEDCYRISDYSLNYSKNNKTVKLSLPNNIGINYLISYLRDIMLKFSFSPDVEILEFLVEDKINVFCHNFNKSVKITSYIKDIDINFRLFNYCTDEDWKVISFDSPDIIYEINSDNTCNFKIATKHGYIDIIENEVKCLRLDKSLVFMMFNFNLYVNISFKDIFIVDNDNPKLKEDFTKLCFFLNLKRDTVLSEGIIKNLRFLAELSEIIPDDLKVKIKDTDYTVYPEYVEYKVKKEEIEKLYEISKLFIENSVYSDFKICSFDGLEVDFINKDVFIKINSNSDDEISKEIDKYCNEILNVADFIKIGYKNSFKIYNRN
jgi:hypothetical protein